MAIRIYSLKKVWIKLRKEDDVDPQSHEGSWEMMTKQRTVKEDKVKAARLSHV